MRRSSRLASTAVLGFLGASLLSGVASAVVLSIDGTIVPQSINRIQAGLNRGENGAPYSNEATPPKPIDPVFDAAESPQVFAVPKTNGAYNKVTFIDLVEGAGYENTFGWYNVGDDLSNLANLHPVLTCSPVNYEPTPAGSGAPAAHSQLTVDFQAEYMAGRYKGGFVGFFLVTPEGQSGACSPGNCGRPDDPNCVGRIYYTEKEINGDGNYVHYLIYQTKLLDAQGKRRSDFYFGFEDLYRGGDNDFEDMMMLVQGLVVPCVPSSEICDGKDNNCDGLIDNVTTDTGTPCYAGPAGTQGVGECKAGVLTCASTGPGDTTKTCVGAVVPTQELCDGLDNNCNGKIDDGPFGAPLPNACPPQTGKCAATTQCLNGAPKCVVQQGPQPETCDGQDNDCNGLVDDNPIDQGQPCTPTGVEPIGGECKQGVSACVGGALACQGYVGPQPETCDGKDNDCNGKIDDGTLAGLAPSCSPGGVKTCQPGAEICVNGAKVCTGFTLGAPELCNGKDDDCNGKVDDNPVDVGGLCGSNVGACQPGAFACVGGKIACVGGVQPSQEICDGIDNDCDGFIDEDPDGPGPMTLPGVGDACSEAAGCTGLQACKDGKLLCVGTGGSAEVCDGKDNDCNGIIDDNPTDVGGLCGNNVGQCVPGLYQCVPTTIGDPSTDQLTCVGGVGPSEEICDGFDNNCNGFVDEDPDGPGPLQLVGTGIDCGTPGCGAGVTACKDGAITCQTKGTGGTLEVCNGKDDDCNGVIDDNPIDTGGVCGNNVGACKPGKLQCVPTKVGDPTTDQLTCVGGVGPAAEVCDGVDNDCNGFIDEDPDGDGPLTLPGVGDSCSKGDGGLCGKGVTACKNGKIECEAVGTSSPEVCNGLDDDCDGIIDNNLVDEGAACGSPFPPCKPGVLKCKAGKLACEGATTGTPEVCDGLDNNCNGIIDEDPDGDGPMALPGAGQDCPPDGLALPLKGLCKPGKTVCLTGKIQCIGAQGPKTEVCDGLDNDCDGTADSPNPCPGGSQCIEGQCSKPCTIGEFTDCPGDQDCIGGFCRKMDGGAGAGGSSGAAGKAGASAGGAAGKAGGSASGAGGTGTTTGGAAGKTAASAGGAAGKGGASNPDDSDGDGKSDNWGLATGGGGCAHAPSAEAPRGLLAAGWLAAVGAIFARRRGARKASKKVVL
jgi:hypothetical protein